MEAPALPGNPAAAPVGDGEAPDSPAVKREHPVGPDSTPIKRRKLSETTASASSSTTTSPPPALSPSGKTSSRPNMTASSSITLDMLRPHFEEPLAKVAANFGICVTLLKKICRRHGIARWPHRQITGLRKSIASMEHAIGYFDGARRESYAEQLNKQKNKLAALLVDPTTSNPLLASDDDDVRRQVKTPPAQGSGNGYEVPPASMTRASSPTGPLLPHSPYCAAVCAAGAPVWYPIQYSTEPSHLQRYHQLCPPSKPLEPQPPVSYCVPNAVPTPTIHLPPLRRESPAILPPLSSLVSSTNSTTAMARW